MGDESSIGMKSLKTSWWVFVSVMKSPDLIETTAEMITTHQDSQTVTSAKPLVLVVDIIYLRVLLIPTPFSNIVETIFYE